MNEKKRLYRSANDKMIAGVCGGMAEYFEIDPTLIRLGMAFAIILGGAGLWIYIVAAIVIPVEPYPANQSVVEVDVVETSEEE